jgi:hypothetical protein
VLRYQPASNWAALTSDPHPRMTIGFGFDLDRPDASTWLKRLGVDLRALRSGREPLSDAQIHQLFDEVLEAAVQLAHERIPGFAGWREEAQWALLELILWLGPEGWESVMSEIEHLSLPLTYEPLQRSEWFDRSPEPALPAPRAAAASLRAPTPTPSNPPPDDGLRHWAREIALTRAQARQRYESATGDLFSALPIEVQTVLTKVARDYGTGASRFWSAVADRRWLDVRYELRGLEQSHPGQGRYGDEAALLDRAIQGGLLPGTAPARESTQPVHPLRLPSHDCHLIFESFEVVAQLVTDRRELLLESAQMLPPGWQESQGEATVQFGLWGDGSITVDGVETHREADRASSVSRLGAVVRHHLAAAAPAHVFIHAGVVEVDGCGIVIPGPTGTGKTTLVAELVRLGATYVSDEYAVVDPGGQIHPFAKPLSIRTGDQQGFGELLLPPPEQVAGQPISSGLIVLTSYRCGGRWRPVVAPKSEGAFALLQNTVSARRRPGSSLRAACRLARDTVVLSGERGEATETAQALVRGVDAEARRR